ncbi:hypothetical protein POVWA2_026070 [Plasmodium ovale wallikeri]|uniref:Uncharacterized protein n=1 Tax=Plasmodium ovale wallikeri TaxID=864142 RepID=A0A1A8ZJD1_PLAOA|nr:hypothetical protein POVWA2_026070 [Plasmodium ovale wallikeri]SBT44159.1 hypothetical protein POVWA1_049220 [Plasmodium ovale wallikeri]
MRYKLFPPLTFLSYLKRLHVYYSPVRSEKADVARYENPPMIEVEYLDGEKEKINIEYFSDRQKKEIIDRWKYTSSLEPFPEVLAPTMEKPKNDI